MHPFSIRQLILSSQKQNCLFVQSHEQAVCLQSTLNQRAGKFHANFLIYYETQFYRLGTYIMSSPQRFNLSTR